MTTTMKLYDDYCKAIADVSAQARKAGKSVLTAQKESVEVKASFDAWQNAVKLSDPETGLEYHGSPCGGNYAACLWG